MLLNSTSSRSLYARWFVVVWFLGGGIGHFVASDFFVSITPPWVPEPLLVVWVSGVFELMGAIGLMVPRYRKWAGAGLFLLTLAVTPANVRMALEPHLYPEIPVILLYVRLLVQVFLLYCIVKGSELIRS